MSFYLQYIVEIFESIYEYDSRFSIGYDDKDDIKVSNESFLFFDSNQSKPSSYVWKSVNGTDIPFLFSKDSFLPIVTYKNKSKAIINYDIIGSAFFFLSGWQEFHSIKRDDTGRFPFSESFQAKNGVITLPIVNYYFDILKTVIEKLSGKVVTRKMWPNSKIAVSLSHDIDKINSGWKEGGYSELKQGRFFNFFKIFYKKLIGKDPWNNISEIVSLERNLKVTSTFFFLTEKGNGNADYSLSEITRYFAEIKKSGSEIALHSSLGSCYNYEQLILEKKKLGSKVIGNRFHFLKFEPKNCALNLEKSEVSYDASLGFAEHIGFRNGLCFPFKLYNLEEKRATNLIEIPLMIMDATLSHKSYMGTNPNKLELLNNVVDQVFKFNGMISILWHNNYFSPYKYPGWKELYVQLIKELSKKDAVFLTCELITKSIRYE